MQRLVAATEVTDFVQRCMEAVGAAGPHAASLGDVLLAADTRGHYSHGLNKLGTQRRGRPLCRSHVLCVVLFKLESESLITVGSSSWSLTASPLVR